MQSNVHFDQFSALDIRVGTVNQCTSVAGLNKPSYVMEIDFGNDMGVLKTSAQVTNLYHSEDLVGRQVIAVVNFPPKQIGHVMSQCLVLGAYTDSGVVLLRPERRCTNGSKIG